MPRPNTAGTRRAVTSKGGTTEAALACLAAAGCHAAIVDAVRAYAPAPLARAPLGEVVVKLVAARRSVSAPVGLTPSALDPRWQLSPHASELAYLRAGDGEYVAVEQIVPPNRGPLAPGLYLRSRATAALR